MLEGKDLILRLFSEDDLAPFTVLYNNIIKRGEFFPVSIHSETESRKEFAENGWWSEHSGRMLITDRGGDLLGGIGFFQSSQYQTGYEIGYGIFKPEDRGKGIMTAALRIFSAYLFEAKSIPRLQVITSVENKPSRHTAEKCGYKYEGTLRQFYFMRGRNFDCDILSLLREDSPSLAEALAV